MANGITRADFLKLGMAAATLPLLPRTARAAADELAIMLSEPPRSMDPADQTATQTSSVLSPVYEGLTKFLPDRTVAPSLATAWTADAAGTSWNFDLRPGVKFHDGTPCDADAVAASFRRHIDPQRGLASGPPASMSGRRPIRITGARSRRCVRSSGRGPRNRG